MVKEWKSKDGLQHEITVYKYNISHDEMIRYWKENGKVLRQFHSISFDSETVYGKVN